MHIASAADNQIANAGMSGGFMSQHINSMFYHWGYANYTYGSFYKELKKRMAQNNLPLYARTNKNFLRDYINLPLFN